MKKTAIAAAVFSFVFTTSVFAAGSQPTTEPGPNFDSRKAEVLKKLDEQMQNIQEAKNCVQAAKTPPDMKACREKHMAERKKMQEELRKNQGG